MLSPTQEEVSMSGKPANLRTSEVPKSIREKHVSFDQSSNMLSEKTDCSSENLPRPLSKRNVLKLVTSFFGKANDSLTYLARRDRVDKYVHRSSPDGLEHDSVNRTSFNQTAEPSLPNNDQTDYLEYNGVDIHLLSDLSKKLKILEKKIGSIKDTVDYNSEELFDKVNFTTSSEGEYDRNSTQSGQTFTAISPSDVSTSNDKPHIPRYNETKFSKKSGAVLSSLNKENEINISELCRETQTKNSPLVKFCNPADPSTITVQNIDMYKILTTVYQTKLGERVSLDVLPNQSYASSDTACHCDALSTESTITKTSANSRRETHPSISEDSSEKCTVIETDYWQLKIKNRPKVRCQTCEERWRSLMTDLDKDQLDLATMQMEEHISSLRRPILKSGMKIEGITQDDVMHQKRPIFARFFGTSSSKQITTILPCQSTVSTVQCSEKGRSVLSLHNRNDSNHSKSIRKFDTDNLNTFSKMCQDTSKGNTSAAEILKNIEKYCSDEANMVLHSATNEEFEKKARRNESCQLDKTNMKEKTFKKEKMEKCDDESNKCKSLKRDPNFKTFSGLLNQYKDVPIENHKSKVHNSDGEKSATNIGNFKSLFLLRNAVQSNVSCNLKDNCGKTNESKREIGKAIDYANYTSTKYLNITDIFANSQDVTLRKQKHNYAAQQDNLPICSCEGNEVTSKQASEESCKQRPRLSDTPIVSVFVVGNQNEDGTTSKTYTEEETVEKKKACKIGSEVLKIHSEARSTNSCKDADRKISSHDQIEVIRNKQDVSYTSRHVHITSKDLTESITKNAEHTFVNTCSFTSTEVNKNLQQSSLRKISSRETIQLPSEENANKRQSNRVQKNRMSSCKKVGCDCAEREARWNPFASLFRSSRTDMSEVRRQWKRQRRLLDRTLDEGQPRFMWPWNRESYIQAKLRRQQIKITEEEVSPRKDKQKQLLIRQYVSLDPIDLSLSSDHSVHACNKDSDHVPAVTSCSSQVPQNASCILQQPVSQHCRIKDSCSSLRRRSSLRIRSSVYRRACHLNLRECDCTQESKPGLLVRLLRGITSRFGRWV